MIGYECKFLHPTPCRKYIENPERSCRAQCKGYHPELANILGPQGNVTTIGASEYISKAQGASKPHLRPMSNSPNNSPNYKSTTSYDRHTKYGLQRPPSIVNTPHPAAYHRHSPCTLTNSLPHPTPLDFVQIKP